MDQFLCFSANKWPKLKFYVFSRRQNPEGLNGGGIREEEWLSSLLYEKKAVHLQHWFLVPYEVNSLMLACWDHMRCLSMFHDNTRFWGLCVSSYVRILYCQSVCLILSYHVLKLNLAPAFERFWWWIAWSLWAMTSGKVLFWSLFLH